MKLYNMIGKADIEEIVSLMEMVLMHHSLIVWDEDTKTLKNIVGVHKNRESIQFNVERWDG